MSAASVGHDDFALERVPQGARYHWFSVAVQRCGQLSSLASFLLGATLGFGMDFWDAVLAITLGAVILEVVTIFTGHHRSAIAPLARRPAERAAGGRDAVAGRGHGDRGRRLDRRRP
jgi:hypothetical protein